MSGSTSQRYLPELRERAVRMVGEVSGEHEPEWAAMGEVAPDEHTMSEATLGNQLIRGLADSQTIAGQGVVDDCFRFPGRREPLGPVTGVAGFEEVTGAARR